MISYIFKNKIKNILLIVFTVLYIISSDFFTGFYYSLITQTPISFYEILGVAAFALILVYMFTLKRQYRFKEWLFPAAFAVLTALTIYEFVLTIAYAMSAYAYWVLIEIISCVSFAIAIIAYAFCFIGSISNFKNVKFLKFGAIIKIVGTVFPTGILLVIEFISLGGMEYFNNIDDAHKTHVYNSMIQLGIEWVFSLLFFVGILLLTTNKKSEDIDITPYVEERKAKKQAKKEAKLQQKEAEEAEYNAPLPEIPEGSWRCMACGKILTDDIDRCECGYKK